MDPDTRTCDAMEPLSIRRNIHTLETLEKAYPKTDKQNFSLSRTFKQQCACSKKRAWKLLAKYIPVLNFLRRYKPREYLLGDFLSGLTVSFMHLPLGLGFGVLSGLRPIYGLYSSFYPVIFYMLFGTSPHISFGTMALMALLTEGVVSREAELYLSQHPNVYTNNSMTNLNNTLQSVDREDEILSVKVGAAMTSSLLVGLLVSGLGIFRLGFITNYMSVSFVGGFTEAAALHILASQLPKILGIAVTSHPGPGKLIKFYIDLFSAIHRSNVSEIIISIICMAILIGVKVGINERFKAKMKIPIPIDLFVVVILTAISHFSNFKSNFAVKTVGTVPSGLPMPQVPDVSSAGRIISDCVVMALLSLTLSITMAKLTAKIHSTSIDDNQELIAYGVSNAASSFFFCFPSATAPPRTMLLSSLGSRTTLSAVPTTIFMFLIIMWIGPLFAALPECVLASMILIAIKDILLQFRDLPRYWRVNKYDFLIWMTTCAVSVFVDLSYGIIAGIIVSIILVIIRHQISSGQLIGVSESEDLYIDVRSNAKIHELPSVKIFQFQNSLYFVTTERFKRQIYNKVINPNKAKRKLSKSKYIGMEKDFEIVINGIDNPVMEKEDVAVKQSSIKPNIKSPEPLEYLILDFQRISYIDIAGVNMLQQIVREFSEINTTILLTRCSQGTISTLESADFFDKFPKHQVFFDIPDAVETIKRKQNKITKM